MSHKSKTYFNWSSGKDASLALYYLHKQEAFNIDKLLTSINSTYNRVSMHGLRRELLELQAEAIGLPLKMLELPENPSMEMYNEIMQKTVDELIHEGYTHCGFGDIFLEDLRKYRESQLAPLGITCLFPLWKMHTKEIIQEFLSLGFKAIVICVNADVLDKSFVGRIIDKSFLDDLPADVDPCGENGEFHTFCFEGPIFHNKIPFKVGDKVYKTYPAPSENKNTKLGFWFCDLIPEIKQ